MVKVLLHALALAVLVAGTPLAAQKSAPAPAHTGMAPASKTSTSGARNASGTAAGARDLATPFRNYPRPAGMRSPGDAFLILPRALPRFTHEPTAEAWASRDVFAEVRQMARRGYIPCTNARTFPRIFSWCLFPAGWWSYAFVVPPKGTLHILLEHPNQAFFRLYLCDRWGFTRKEGMLQNLHPTGRPEVSFINPLPDPTTVYVVVDDPMWLSSEKNPYTLLVERNWDPAAVPTPEHPPVLGIWAESTTNLPQLKVPEEKTPETAS